MYNYFFKKISNPCNLFTRGVRPYQKNKNISQYSMEILVHKKSNVSQLIISVQ